jgi:hypothetical protein
MAETDFEKQIIGALAILNRQMGMIAGDIRSIRDTMAETAKAKGASDPLKPAEALSQMEPGSFQTKVV